MSKNHDEGTIEVLSAIEAFYSSDNFIESEEICLHSLQKTLIHF